MLGKIDNSTAFLPMFFKNSMEMIIGYLELAHGLGLMFGYILSSILYDIGGYELIFYLNGVLMIVPLYYTLLYVPDTYRIIEYYQKN